MLTRDSFVWALGVALSMVTYLIADGRNPVVWVYLDWLKFAAMCISTLCGKLATSPLKHSDDV